jgi:hypothetical protein
MPRSVSDGGSGGSGGSGRFRSVFARSPLGQSTSSDDSVPTIASTNATSSFSSNYTTIPEKHHSRSGSDHGDERPIMGFVRRRSHSHRERNRPSLSMTKLSLHLSTDTVSPSSLSGDIDFAPSKWEDSFGRILHHGDAQLSHSTWRKRYEYLVLTEHYLFRFKNSKKAAESFPWILPANAHMQRPDSVISVQDAESLSGTESPTDFSASKSASICLQDVIGTQVISDNRSRVEVDIVWHSPTHKASSSLSVIVDRQGGHAHWIESLGQAVQNSQAKKGNSISSTCWPIIHENIGSEADNLSDHYISRLFPVYRRQCQQHDSASSGLDEFSKDHHSLTFLLVGRFKIHLITFPKNYRASTISLHESSKLHISSYGITTLICLSISEKDDSFELVFR